MSLTRTRIAQQRLTTQRLLEPLKKLAKEELAAIERPVERYAAFLGLPVRVRTL